MQRDLDDRQMEQLLRTVAEYEEFAELCGEGEALSDGELDEAAAAGQAPDYQRFLRLTRTREKEKILMDRDI